MRTYSYKFFLGRRFSAGRRIVAWLAFFSIFFTNSVIYGSIISYAENDSSYETLSNNDLYALSAVLMDGESGRILYDKAGDEVRANASTTKILTCILALEYGNIDDTVSVSAYAEKMPDVQLNMKEGEEYILEDLLYSLMLESHNDSAVAIAEHISGSVTAFADLMNEKAKEIGCTSTHFITPNGLDAEDEYGIHGTTACDLALILRYCITLSPEKDMFLEITRTASYGFTDASGSRSFTCTNHNSFLNMMDGALTGKTGFTGNAGYCYVGALERDGHIFIVALLACGWPNNKTYKWSDTKKLMNYGINNYSETEISDEMTDGISVNVKVSLDTKDNICMELKSSFSYNLMLREDEQISFKYIFPEAMSAPIKEGAQAGSVLIYIDDYLYDIEPLYTTLEIKEMTFYDYLEEVIDKYFITYD